MNIPFTYLLRWKDQNKSYYGVRYGKNSYPNTLWKTYFSSSKEVHKMRDLYGDPDIIEIRKTFNNPENALKWETKVLKRLKVRTNDKWLNINENGPVKFCNHMLGKIHSKETREKISKATKGRKAWNKGLQNDFTKNRMLSNNPMKSKEISLKVSESLKEGFKTGRLVQHNKISEEIDWYCEYCNKHKIILNKTKERNKRFCNKSCSASYNNKKRTGFKSKN